jgi:hypothetical protein
MANRARRIKRRGHWRRTPGSRHDVRSTHLQILLQEKAMTEDPNLARALGYPYPAPPGDFVWHDGAARPFDGQVSLVDRVPVLAVGSNRAPGQLQRKFGDAATVPVTIARLRDHDVVYSAHMASYGSIAATLAESSGTFVTVSLTWLTDAQLDRMHETESLGSNYDYGIAETLEIDIGPGRPSVSIGCYLGRRGAFAPDGAPVRLAEIFAARQVFAAMTQKQILARAHAEFGEGVDFDAWLARLIRDRERRALLTERMAGHAVPNTLAAFKIVAP